MGAASVSPLVRVSAHVRTQKRQKQKTDEILNWLGLSFNDPGHH